LEFGSRLHLVHATGASPDAPDAADDSKAGWQAAVHKSAGEELLRLQKFVGMEAGSSVESGEPAKVICSTAGRVGADLLVIGRGSAAGVFGRLRTNAYAIIRESPCPVVSV
jgi:nucleotide-binding universal stress UspA family protein